MAGEIQIKFTGSKTEASFAASFATANQTRSSTPTSGLAERFFPPNYIQKSKTFDLTPAARSSSRSITDTETSKPDELIVLELVDGGLLITSAERFHDGLREARPDLLEKDVVQLDKLNTEFSATRGIVGSLAKGFIKTISVLTLDPKPGDGILDAAQTLFEKDSKKNWQDITWGAFQAYGDPGWMAESLPEDVDDASVDAHYVALEEFLEDLADTRVRLAHQHDSIAPYDSDAMANRVKLLTDKRCPPNWQNLPEMHSALGTTWRELNRNMAAYREFLASIQWEDRFGRVPIHDIEQLADVESRLGEQQGAEGYSRNDPDLQKKGDALIRRARRRLASLNALAASPQQVGDDGTGKGAGTDEPFLESRVNCARTALLANVLKRKASLRAYELQSTADPARKELLREHIKRYLGAAIKEYEGAEGSPGSGRFAPELVLDRLALVALTQPSEEALTTKNIALTRFCANSGEDHASEWAGAARQLLAPKALLVRHLLQRTLGADNDASQLALEEITTAYVQATSNITLKPSEIDTLVGDAGTLARFYKALGRGRPRKEAGLMTRTAARLEELARRLRPAETQGKQWGDSDSARPHA